MTAVLMSLAWPIVMFKRLIATTTALATPDVHLDAIIATLRFAIVEIMKQILNFWPVKKLSKKFT